MPGKVVITTIEIDQQTRDKEDQPAEVYPPLRMDVPGFTNLVQAVGKLLLSDEAAEKFPFEYNFVTQGNLIQEALAAAGALRLARHLVAGIHGESILRSVIREILRSHEQAWEPEWLGSFDTFGHWYSHGAAVMADPRIVCMDTLGRRCIEPVDFTKSSEENAFPVRYFRTFRRKQWLPVLIPGVNAPETPQQAEDGDNGVQPGRVDEARGAGS